MSRVVLMTVGLLAVGCEGERRAAGPMPVASPTKPARPSNPVPEFVNGDGEVVGQTYYVAVRNRGGAGTIRVNVEWKWAAGADTKPFSQLGMYFAEKTAFLGEDEQQVLSFPIPDGFSGRIAVTAKSS